MRTTVTIDDHLLAEAKAVAARSHRTLGSVVEDALRKLLAEYDKPRYELPTSGVPFTTDGEGGLRPGVDLEDKELMAELLGDNEFPHHVGP
ncbi:MAG: type II toxin-antitoxin system VapB family antitoxin [Sciscionella sp.]|nr:type II toxin-antitoxin system VapB family antitoxin [Sciscionella sp.]